MAVERFAPHPTSNCTVASVTLYCVSFVAITQARAQGFSHNVIIVGTHLDKISRQEREAKKKLWTELLER